MFDLFNMHAEIGAREFLLWGVQVACAGLIARRASALRVHPSIAVCTLCILGSWAVRCAIQGVLFGTGFLFFWIDDALRFTQAFEWAHSPSFLGSETVWLPGTQYLHGLAMRLVREDPLAASRAAAQFSNLLCLGGIFLFTQGLFRNRLLSCTSVFIAGPWWMHVLLGTGALAEIPTVGLVLAGSGLLLLGLGEERARPRNALFVLSAFAFASATTLHVLAWSELGIIISTLVVARIRRRSLIGSRTLLLYVLGSIPFCIAYVVASELRYGEPLRFIHESAILEKSSQVPAWSVHLLALFFSTVLYLPLLVLGMTRAIRAQDESFARVRVVLLMLLLHLIFLCVVAEIYGTTPTPYRATLLLSTALISFAANGLIPRASTFSTAEVTEGRFQVQAPVFLLGAVCALWVQVNFHESLARQKMEANYKGTLGSMEMFQPSALAMGTWLREETYSHRPKLLSPENLRSPIKLLFTRTGTWEPWLSWLCMTYRSGNPRLFEPSSWHPYTHHFDISELDRLSAGQLVLIDQAISDRRFMEIVVFPPYRLYERSGIGTASHRSGL